MCRRARITAMVGAAVLIIDLTPAQASGCDALIAKMIRGTGASFAGQSGRLAVFRAADAERMSLDCGRSRQMVLASLHREPPRNYFVLIGLAAQTLLGARAASVEDLAIRVQREALASGQPQEGRAGPARLRCSTSDRPDGFSDGTFCRLDADRGSKLRRKAALPANVPAR